MAQKFVTNNAGTLTEVAANLTSAGASDGGKIPALNASGTLDVSFMPTGIGPDTASIIASESLAAGAFVNIWNNAGVANVRNATATGTGKDAHGFVLAPFSSLATALVYFGGPNTAVSAATPGQVFLGSGAGTFSSTAITGTGNTVQRIGMAASATNIIFEPSAPVVLA